MRIQLVVGLAIAIFNVPSAVAHTDSLSDLTQMSHHFQPLVGGGTSPEVIDVNEIPFLALPPGSSEEEISISQDLESNNSLEKSFPDGSTIQQSTGYSCATATGPLPAPGWTITYLGNKNTCAPPFSSGYYSICVAGNYCYNQYNYTSFYDIPIGGTLRYCSAAGVPAGWQVTQVNLPSSCGNSGADYVMQHVSCVSGRDTNCYPQNASISASPKTLLVPYGISTGATTVSWSSANHNNPCVWIESQPGGFPRLWACSGSGSHSGVWSYVPNGGTTKFWISGGGSASSSPMLASVVVTGNPGLAPILSASPAVVAIPSGQTTGNTTVSYNLSGSGHSTMCVWILSTGGVQRLWACGGATLSQVWPYVPKGGNTKFSLSPSQTSAQPELASFIVVGQ